MSLVLIQCATPKNVQQDEERQGLEAQYNVPKFSNDNAQDFAYDFLLYYLETEARKEKGEEVSMEEILEKAEEFKNKTEDFKDSMTMEDTQKITEWTTQLLMQTGQRK